MLICATGKLPRPVALYIGKAPLSGVSHFHRERALLNALDETKPRKLLEALGCGVFRDIAPGSSIPHT
jgi:hypothetical protein